MIDVERDDLIEAGIDEILQRLFVQLVPASA